MLFKVPHSIISFYLNRIKSYFLCLYFIFFSTLALFTKGNYSLATVLLSGNKLTHFEEGAFKSMLEDLYLIKAGLDGFLEVDKSKLYKAHIFKIQ